MGLYISRIYCERHGGKLLIKNAADGGAEIEAVFKKLCIRKTTAENKMAVVFCCDL